MPDDQTAPRPDDIGLDDARQAASMNGHQSVYSDLEIAEIVFRGIEHGDPKGVALEPWALRSFARLWRTNKDDFERSVVQPAYQSGVRLFSLFEMVQREVIRQTSTTALPRPQPAEELLHEEFPPTRTFVKDILVEGMTFLAGKPKKGKSYMALDMSLALAVGRLAFQHFPTEQARVLYVSLEDGPRRLQRRLRAIQPNISNPKGLDFLYTFPRLGAGAVEQLHAYAQQYEVIIVDVLGRVLPEASVVRKNLSEYQEFTDHLGAIQTLAQEEHIAILIIDHVRKAAAEDVFDTIIGTQGKWGSADNGLVYERKGEEKDAVLHTAGRELEEQKIVLTMTDGHITYMGTGDLFEMDSEQNRIIQILEEEHRPMGLPDLMKALGLNEAHYKRFRVLMHRLYHEDRIGRTKRGMYTLYGHDRHLDDVPF
jgi:AAA domain